VKSLDCERVGDFKLRWNVKSIERVHARPWRTATHQLLELVEGFIRTLRNHFNGSVPQIAREPTQAESLCLPPHEPPEPDPLYPPPGDPAAAAHGKGCRRRRRTYTAAATATIGINATIVQVTYRLTSSLRNAASFRPKA